MEGHLTSVQEPRKRSYTAKKESIVQLKMDFANGDIPNRVQFIQCMAQFLVAAHNELIHPDDLFEFEGKEANNDQTS